MLKWDIQEIYKEKGENPKRSISLEVSMCEPFRLTYSHAFTPMSNIKPLYIDGSDFQGSMKEALTAVFQSIADEWDNLSEQGVFVRLVDPQNVKSLTSEYARQSTTNIEVYRTLKHPRTVGALSHIVGSLPGLGSADLTKIKVSLPLPFQDHFIVSRLMEHNVPLPGARICEGTLGHSAVRASKSL